MFSTVPKTNFNISATVNLLSAISSYLDRSKNVSFGKELFIYQMIKSLALPNSREFVYDNFNVTQTIKGVFQIVRKHCFQKLFLASSEVCILQ